MTKRFSQKDEDDWEILDRNKHFAYAHSGYQAEKIIQELNELVETNRELYKDNKQLKEENEQLKQKLQQCRKFLNDDLDIALGFISHKGYSLKDLKEYEKKLKGDV